MEQKTRKKIVSQKIYFYVTVIFLLIGIAAITLSTIISSGVLPKESVPLSILEVLNALYYYQAFHFILGIGLIVWLTYRKRKGGHQSKLFKMYLGLLLTVINFFLIFTSVFMLGVILLN